ncbi:MAG: signal peptidase I [Methylophilaceae bacterium]|nr:signal peptidase I [Methylophilaceae bacterium]
MNFALFMLAALLLTGLVWLVDALWLKKSRAAGAKEPMLVEYSKSFFPVILAVFLIRSFLVEPFKIPSGSMMPTLLVGDYILVNKYTYGLRVPVLNDIFLEINHPQRGEVMVFRYPKDPSLDYIKRVVGLPGDHIAYRNKQIFVNGQPVPQQEDGYYDYVAPGLNQVSLRRLQEQLGEHRHHILIDDATPVLDGEITVPEGHYFVMGDNRDNSNDSRFWGFVPDRNVVGKAFMIWWNFDKLGRIGTSIN